MNNASTSFLTQQREYAKAELFADGEMEIVRNMEAVDRSRKRLRMIREGKVRSLQGSHEQVLAICDPDQVYCSRLDGYLRDHLQVPFDIQEFTSIDRLLQNDEREGLFILLISGSFYKKLSQKQRLRFPETIVLEEEDREMVAEGSAGTERSVSAAHPGLVRDREVPYGEKEDIKGSALKPVRISKYVPAGKVMEAVLDKCMDMPGVVSMKPAFSGTKLKILGVYTPLSRCLQTSFAMTLGQILAENAKVLYLNFEPYSCLEALTGQQAESDIADLLYFFDCYTDKLPLYLEKIKQSAGKLDYVPAARSYMEIRDVRMEKWEALLQAIADGTAYDYLILDLSEQVEGLLEILSLCNRVFTITRNDPASKAKMEQYAHMLRVNGYEEVEQKTTRPCFPIFHKLPTRVERFGSGELASFVRQMMSDLHPQMALG